MNKLKYLFKNTLIFGVSQFASKVMVFLLLPLYTSTLTTQEYGIADLVISTVGLLLPIFTVQLSCTVMRYGIENHEQANRYLIVAIRTIIVGFLLLLVGWPIFEKLNIFGDYVYLFYLMYIANAFYELFGHYSRAMERIKLVGTVGVINTIVVISSNVLFLVILKKGVFGYLFSYVLGNTVGISIYILGLRKKLFEKQGMPNKEISKEMFRYALPLVPNSVSWWAVSSANKFVVNSFLSESILGLYSVALKIPTIINTIQNILAEALVLSVLKEYDNKERDEKYFSLLYKLYAFSIAVFTSGIIFATKILASFLFSKDFFQAWKFVPLLCISSVWGALSGYLGTFYSASKKNKGIFLSTLIGGIVTITLSFVTVEFMGVIGVAISNILAYFVIWLYRWIDVKKFVKLEVCFLRDATTWVVLIVQAIIMMCVETEVIMYIFSFICMLTILALYIDVLTVMINKFIKKTRQK